jgi:hypothetical protein
MRRIVLAIFLFSIFFAWEYGSPYFFSKELEVVVTENAASRTCSEGAVRFFGKTRSERPSTNVLGYCGAVITDHGSLDLVESGTFLLGADKREHIFDALQPGCRATVLVTGLGAPPRQGDIATTGTRWMVLSLKGLISCDLRP